MLHSAANFPQKGLSENGAGEFMQLSAGITRPFSRELFLRPLVTLFRRPQIGFHTGQGRRPKKCP